MPGEITISSLPEQLQNIIRDNCDVKDDKVSREQLANLLQNTSVYELNKTYTVMINSLLLEADKKVPQLNGNANWGNVGDSFVQTVKAPYALNAETPEKVKEEIPTRTHKYREDGSKEEVSEHYLDGTTYIYKYDKQEHLKTKVEYNNFDSATKYTKYDEEGNITQERVLLSRIDIKNITTDSLKKFGMSLICDENGDISTLKCVEAGAGILAAGAVCYVAGTAAAAAVSYAGAGTALADLAAVKGAASAFASAGTATLMLSPLIEDGTKKTIDGATAYKNAKTKEEAVAGMSEQMDGVAELSSVPVMGWLFKRVGKVFGRTNKIFNEGKQKTEPVKTEVKPKETIPTKASNDVKVVNTVYDENGVEIQNVQRMPNRNNPNNITEITQTYNTENGKTTVEKSTFVNRDPVIQRRSSMLKYAQDKAKGMFSQHMDRVENVLRKDPKLIDELYEVKNANGEPIFNDEAAIFNYIEAVSEGIDPEARSSFMPDYVRTNMNNPAMQQLMLTEKSPTAAVKKFFKYKLWETNKK